MTMEIPVLNKYFEDIIEVRDQLSAIPNCLSKSSSKYERKLTFDDKMTAVTWLLSSKKSKPNVQPYNEIL
ncbi:MAG TPA: hypothetical protein VIW25_00210 [Nitrososphaeraceae archaeon]